MLWKFQRKVIEFPDFTNVYKKCTVKLYSFSVIDSTLASDNSSVFWKNVSEKIQMLIKLIIKIEEKIIDGKIQYFINREVA